jgi:hypothetical protein
MKTAVIIISVILLLCISISVYIFLDRPDYRSIAQEIDKFLDKQPAVEEFEQFLSLKYELEWNKKSAYFPETWIPGTNETIINAEMIYYAIKSNEVRIPFITRGLFVNVLLNDKRIVRYYEIQFRTDAT